VGIFSLRSFFANLDPRFSGKKRSEQTDTVLDEMLSLIELE
jgi:hypothetical protein